MLKIQKKAKKKSGNSKLIILVLIIAALGVVAACIVPTMLEKKEEPKQNKKEDNPTIEKLNEMNLTKDSEVVQKLFNAFREDNINSYYYASGNYDDSENSIKVDYKMYVAFYNLEKSNFVETTCGTLGQISEENNYYCYDDATKLDENLEKLNTKEKIEEFLKDNKIEVISADKVENKYKELFGQDSTFTNKSFNGNVDGVVVVHYDSKANNYSEFKCIRCGGESYGLTNQVISDVIHNENDLSIVTTGTLNDWDSKTDKETKKDVTITYNFKYEESTNRFIWVSREEK